MADLTAFSCGNFDTATWINDSFRERPEEEALESYLASLAMKLHIISQDYTDQLETGPSALQISSINVPAVRSNIYSNVFQKFINLSYSME
jgi:hypothetical protein